MKKRKFKCLHATERIFNIIDFFSKSLETSKVDLLSDVFEALFDAGANYPKNARMLVDVLGDKVTIVFAGRPVVQSGTFQTSMTDTPEQVDAEVKKRIESQIEGEKKNAK